MPATSDHPSLADLAAFTLGTLDDAATEDHIATCVACQERAAKASGDTLVELLRRAHAHANPWPDTLSEVAADTQPPVRCDLEAETLAPDPNRAEAWVDAPGELANHVRYRIIRQLGAGGMGTVYEAEHLVMQRSVALKVINRAFTASPTSVDRFRREVRAAAKLSHLNIVTAFDAETAGDTHFLVMEYVEGITLARLVKERGPLPVDEACEYVRQAALGLQHAHERGMVHRDVKPDNLIRCADGTVKVLDFGLAALTAERGIEGLTEANVVMGTPDFMAPEQAEDAHTADIRADVYSLGCTLYYLLTGTVPYPATTSLLRILAHREQPIPAIRKARSDVPPELGPIVRRLLAKKPEDRYRTPGEVVKALEPFAKKREQKPRRGWRVAVAAAFLAAAVLAGIVICQIQTDNGKLVITTESDDVDVIVKQGGKVVRIIDTKTDRSITLRSGVYELELKGGEGLKLDIPKATLKRGDTVLATIERSKKAVPIVKEEPKIPAKVAEVRLFHWGHPAIPQIPWADFSPDGRLLLASANGGGAKLFDLRTGRTVRDLTVKLWGQAFFTAKGKRIVGWQGSGLRVLETETGAVVRDLPQTAGWMAGFRVSPTGPHAFTSTGNTPSVSQLWDLDTGKELRRWDEGLLRPRRFTSDGKNLMLFGGAMRLYNLADRKEHVSAPHDRLPNRGSLISSDLPDCKELLVSDDGVLNFHDAASGKAVRLIELGVGLRGGQVREGILSRDRRLFVCPATDGSLRLWDLVAGHELCRYLEVGRKPYTDPVFSPDGRHVAIGRSGAVAVVEVPELPPAKAKP